MERCRGYDLGKAAFVVHRDDHRVYERSPTEVHRPSARCDGCHNLAHSNRRFGFARVVGARRCCKSWRHSENTIVDLSHASLSTLLTPMRRRDVLKLIPAGLASLALPLGTRRGWAHPILEQ